jgi:hypothetical protein
VKYLEMVEVVWVQYKLAVEEEAEEQLEEQQE